MEAFQSSDALRKLLSDLDFGFSNNSWIEDHLPIFGILYYKDIFKRILFHFAHIPFQVCLDFEPVRIADLGSRETYCEIHTSDGWWDMQDQLPARPTFVPVIWASNKTHLTNVSGDQHAWPLYLTIGDIWKDICCTPKQHAWIPPRLIARHWNGVKNIELAWHSTVGTVLSPLQNLDITGPGL